MNIDMPHSAEVTAARLDDAEDRYAARLSADELAAIRVVRDALDRIAREDRDSLAHSDI